MTKATILTVAFALATSVGGFSQPRPLTLGELFELADSQNSDIITSRQGEDVARQKLNVARSSRLPDIQASLTLSYLGDGTILDRDFSNPRRDPLPHFSNQLGVEVYQPVYTGGAITGGIEMAEQEIGLATIGTDASRNDVRMAIATNYLNLCKHTNLMEVYCENIALTEKLLDEMRARYREGVVLKNDITRYELRLSTIRYDSIATANAIAICNRNLVSLTGLPTATEILATAPPAGTQRGIAEWTGAVQNNSPQLMSIGQLTEMERTARRITRSEYLPKIGLVAGDHLQGPVTFEVPALNTNYNAWFVGVNVKWSVSSLFTTGKSLRRHNARIEQLQLQHAEVSDGIERRLNEAYTLYDQAYDRLEIERKNLQLAEDNYAVVSNRFDNQLALLTDMLDASTARLDAGVRLVNAEISVLFHYYQLHYITGTLTTL